jgi:hypothetical protein
MSALGGAIGIGRTLLSCLHLYTERYAPLLSEMQSDVEEFLATGSIRRARELTAATGQRFTADWLPQFFTGDLDRPVVLVHLQPQAGEGPGAAT